MYARKSVEGMGRGLCMALAAVVTAAPAWAGDTQLTFRGPIAVMQGNPLPAPWGATSVGDQWQMSVCFDDQSQSSCGTTTTGCYRAIHTARLQVGSTVVTQSGPGTGSIEITHDGVHRSAYRVTVTIGSDVTASVILGGEPHLLGSVELLPCERMPALDQWTLSEFRLETTLALPGSAIGRVGQQTCDHVIGCTPCPRGCIGDYDGMNGVDGDDVIAFFGDWDASLPCADVNHSGGVDGDDVIRFFRAWDSGRCCPPAPDHNGDGRVSREDQCEFRSDFEAGYPCADVNDDGQVDVEDSLAFDSLYEQAGGPGLPVGADVNRDGRVTACDQGAFVGAFISGDLLADMDGDCAVSVDDAGLFNAAFTRLTQVDWNRNGQADCGDPRAFGASIRAGEAAADFNCDGSLDVQDVGDFFTMFSIMYTGPACPTGADFDLDGRINCADINAFLGAYNAGDLRADYDGDGVLGAGDVNTFGALYLDWDRDGQLECDDTCAYLDDFAAMSQDADIDCDGAVDVQDATAYFNFFGILYQGPACPAC